MRLLFHAGTHKTGTTSIQRALAENRDGLRTQGLLYPDPRPFFDGSGDAHHQFVHAIGSQDPAREAAAQAFVDAVRTQARSTDTVVLSAEPAYRWATGDPSQDWWSRHEDFLQRLAAALDTFTVEVLLVFRRRDTFIESVFHEMTALGHGRTFEAMINRFGPRLLDYDRQVSSFGKAFDAVRRHDYERLSAAGLPGSFVELLGAALPDPPRTGARPHLRRSNDARVSLWLAEHNAAVGCRDDGSTRGTFARSPQCREVFDDFGRRTLWPDVVRRRALLEQYGDLEPIEDDRPPAELTDAVRHTLDRAYEQWAVRPCANTTDAQAQQRPGQRTPTPPPNQPERATMTAATNHSCPACDSDVDAFLPGGPKRRPNAKCPHCGALERHRFLCYLIRRHAPYLGTSDVVLDIAPQTQVATVLRDAAGAAYVATDLFAELDVDTLMDITALALPTDSVDAIVCYHVLEHIPDDARAMQELARVLKPGGMLLMQVPWARDQLTEEDPDASVEERIRRFGQDDHVRLYGSDLETRLAANGLRPGRLAPSAVMSKSELQRYGIPGRAVMWVCRPTSPFTLTDPPTLEVPKDPPAVAMAGRADPPMAASEADPAAAGGQRAGLAGSTVAVHARDAARSLHSALRRIPALERSLDKAAATIRSTDWWSTDVR